MERHVQEVNALLKPSFPNEDDSDHDQDSSDAGEEWAGIADPEPVPVDHEAEYIDEDKYTTVTVETLDVSREALFKVEQESGQTDPPQIGTEDVDKEPPTEDKRRRWTKDKPKAKSTKVQKKRRNFRYESKGERKMSRTKERAKNSKQARERRAG